MKIQLAQLSEGKHSLDFKWDSKEIGLKEPFQNEVDVHIALEKFEYKAVLKIEASNVAMFCCDRCLKEFSKKIEIVFSLIINNGEGDSYQDFEMNEIVISHWSQAVDISKDLCEYFELAIPQKILCDDDCAGLCYSCGKNLNELPGFKCDCENNQIDPRWNELKKISGN